MSRFLSKIYIFIFLIVSSAPQLAEARPDLEKVFQFLTRTVDTSFRIEETKVGFIEHQITHGLEILNELIRGNLPESRTAEEKSKNVAALSWALFYLAIEKEQPFDQGSFVIEDQHGTIFRYLSDPRISYPRPSSHLNLLKKETQSSHFGIDFQGCFLSDGLDWKPYCPSSWITGMWFKELPILPTQKAHLLFGRMASGENTYLKTDHVFIKFEDHGLGTATGLFGHTLDYLQMTKGLNLRMISQPNWGRFVRVERVDSGIIYLFEQVLSEYYSSHPKEFEDAAMKAHEYGIRYMITEINRIIKLHPHEMPVSLRIPITRFNEGLERRKLDHLDARTGNEVIFSADEIVSLSSAHEDLLD